MMLLNIWHLWITVIFVIGMISISCDDQTQPTPPIFTPRNVRIEINEGAAATRDTILRVSITGEDIVLMQLSSEPVLREDAWIPYDSLYIIHAPHVEGTCTIYGWFESESGGRSETIQDDIRFDFTAQIISLDVQSEADTLRSGTWIEFTINTGEYGEAEVGLGNFIRAYPLDCIDDGIFYRLLVLPFVVPREDSVRIIGRFIDGVGNIADSVVFNRIFVLRGNQLNPRVISRIPVGREGNTDIFYHRGFCYITDFEKFHIIDVRDPYSPVYKGIIRTVSGNHGLTLCGDYLLVTDSQTGLRIYDANLPDRPIFVGAERAIWGQALDVIANNNVAYVSCRFSGVHVVDLSEPDQPKIQTRVPIPCEGETICINDSIVYVAGVGGLALINITEPVDTVIISQVISFNDAPNSIVYHDGNVFLASYEDGVYRVDVRNPFDPEFKAFYSHLEKAVGLAVSHPYLFVSRIEMISIVNISNLEELPIVAEIPEMRHSKELFVHERFVYVVENGRMSIIDISAED